MLGVFVTAEPCFQATFLFLDVFLIREPTENAFIWNLEKVSWFAFAPVSGFQ